MQSGSEAGYIEKILPEIQLIKDTVLRKKVVAVWVEAWRRSGWDKPEHIPRKRGLSSSGASDVSVIQHTRDSTNLSIEFAKVLSKSFPHIKINDDYLIAGAILHDVGKGVEYKLPEGLARHCIIGSHLAMEAGLPEEIVHIIAFHGLEGNSPLVKRTRECKLLYYVDDAINSKDLTT